MSYLEILTGSASVVALVVCILACIRKKRYATAPQGIVGTSCSVVSLAVLKELLLHVAILEIDFGTVLIVQKMMPPVAFGISIDDVLTSFAKLWCATG